VTAPPLERRLVVHGRITPVPPASREPQEVDPQQGIGVAEAAGPGDDMASVGRECVDGAVVDLAERRQVRNAERVEDAASGLATRQDEVGIARAVGGEGPVAKVGVRAVECRRRYGS
jgi:hypothetical protein